MACKRYEILLVDMQGQAKQTRAWTEAQLLASVAWLKRMNARGHDVLVRPSGQTSLVLLDGLKKVDVANLERSGVPCSAKIQVDEGHFQIWLRLGGASVRSTMRDGITTSLRLPTSNAVQFGALAGFVKHQSIAIGERNSFVLARELVRPSPEAVAKWEQMLMDAEQLCQIQEQDKCHNRDKGFYR